MYAQLELTNVPHSLSLFLSRCVCACVCARARVCMHVRLWVFFSAPSLSLFLPTPLPPSQSLTPPCTSEQSPRCWATRQPLCSHSSRQQHRRHHHRHHHSSSSSWPLTALTSPHSCTPTHPHPPPPLPPLSPSHHPPSPPLRRLWTPGRTCTPMQSSWRWGHPDIRPHLPPSHPSSP